MGAGGQASDLWGTAGYGTQVPLSTEKRMQVPEDPSPSQGAGGRDLGP